jgi:hypothetical protein
VPKKSKPAKRRPEGVTRDKWQVTGKTKPLYRRTAPKPAGHVTGDKWQVTGKAKAVGRESSRAVTPQSEFRHPHLLAPSHFSLREDGSIGAPASGTARSDSSPQPAVLEAGAPGFSTLNAQPSTMPPRLAFTHPQTRKTLGVECKYQAVPGTAEEKIPATIKDIAAWPIPGIVVFAGVGFTENMKSFLISTGKAVEFSELEPWLRLFFGLPLTD